MAGKALLFLSALMLFATTLINGYVPVPAPKVAPALPPQVPTVHVHRTHGNCVARCIIYCNPHHSKRSCERVCVPCCDILKCVPGPSTTCNNWTQVLYYGTIVNCPKIYGPSPAHSPK